MLRRKKPDPRKWPHVSLTRSPVKKCLGGNFLGEPFYLFLLFADTKDLLLEYLKQKK